MPEKPGQELETEIAAEVDMDASRRKMASRQFDDRHRASTVTGMVEEKVALIW